jgi:hypothetical protein
MDWDEHNERKQKEGKARRLFASRQFKTVSNLAKEYGFELKQFSESHYQLIHCKKGWILNIYPGNRRLYTDPKRKAPYLNVSASWDLMEVLTAAIEAEPEKEIA